MRRNLWACAALLAAALWLAPAAAARVIVRVAAVVGPDIISTFEVERLFAFEKQNIDPRLSGAERAEAEARTKNMILQVLVQDKLLDQEIDRLGLAVTEMEVDDALAELMEQSGMRQAELDAALAAEGRTPADLREQLSRRIKKERYVQYRLKGGVTVGDEEAFNYYQQHLDEYQRSPIVELGEIRINVPGDADEAEVAELYAEALGLLQRVAGGEDFRQVARASSDAASREDGGSLGLIPDPRALKQEYQQALKGLRPGQLSGVQRDDKGFFFLTVLGEQSAGTIPFAEVEAKVRRILFNKAVDREMQKIDRELRSKTHVEIKVDYLKELNQGGEGN